MKMILIKMEKPIFTKEEQELMNEARRECQVRYSCKEDFYDEKIMEVLG